MKLTYRTIVWSLGAIFLYTLFIGQIDSWFNLDWSYMRWWALIGDIIALFVGFGLDQYYAVKEDLDEKETAQ